MFISALSQPFNQTRRKLRYSIFALLTISMSLLSTTAISDDLQIEVWKSPTCGCCQGWIDYLSDSGFKVTSHNVSDVSLIKRELGITDPSLYSCHTARIGDYLIEGHVPVKDINRLLEEKPDILGIAAPGMPMMSPGMNSIEPMDYDVIQFKHNQKTALFSRY